MIYKLKRSMANGGVLEKNLAAILANDGGDVKWNKNQSGGIRVLWVQTRSMAQDVSVSKPYVLETDTTFGTIR